MSDSYYNYKLMKKQYKDLKRNLQTGGALQNGERCYRKLTNGKVINYCKTGAKTVPCDPQEEGSCGRMTYCYDREQQDKKLVAGNMYEGQLERGRCGRKKK